MPFFTMNINETGFFDFEYITRKRLSFPEIEKSLKENRYETIQQVCEDLKHLISNISDYLLSTDPLQELCTRAFRMINEFEVKFVEEFRENKPVVQPNKPNKK